MNSPVFFQLIRAKQWVKNLLIFAPIFFAEKMLDTPLLKDVLLAFAAFCCLASAVYILNDYQDRAKDRQHPTKRFRPLAAGQVTPRQALFTFSIFLALALTFALFVGQTLLLILAIYLIINLLYSFYLKKIALLDVALIAVGFLLRIMAGSLPMGILISKWLILMIFLTAMFIGIAKRRSELVLETESTTRPALDGYNLQFTDMAMVLMASVTLVSYILYTVSPEVVARLGNDWIYLTSFFVLMGILRYLQLTIVFHRTESPTEVFWSDRFIQFVLFGWAMLFAYFLYF